MKAGIVDNNLAYIHECIALIDCPCRVSH